MATELVPRKCLRFPEFATTVNSFFSFFKNTGAVAGVFVLVGLTISSILLWILFAIRRRRRTQREDRDSAVSATLAAAGLHRSPLEDDDDLHPAPSHRSNYGTPDPEMNQRSSSGFAVNTPSSALSAARISTYQDSPNQDDITHQDPFNPYADYGTANRDGYVYGRNTSPPPVAFHNRDRHNSSTSAGDYIASHSTSGSYEPLLAAYYRTASDASSPLPPQSPPTPPPRNPQRVSDAAKSLPSVVSGNLENPDNLSPSTESGFHNAADDRLDPGLRSRPQDEVADLKDNEDYSRPVLGVRCHCNSLSITHLSALFRCGTSQTPRAKSLTGPKFRIPQKKNS